MRTLALVFALGGAACGGSEAPPKLPDCSQPVSGTTITTQMVGQVVGGAMLATAPVGDPRLFVLEQRGAIRIFDGVTLLPDPFLDISEAIAAGGERGLLGLAFHPRYYSNGRFFIFYTTNDANVVAGCTVSADNPNLANPTCTPILSIPDFASNHNGGMIEFGKDGYLYIGTGDGGGGGDPNRTAQDPNALLGKILRIDIDSTANGKSYGIPSSNPFASGGGAPEVFILGLRNPWRWSFDTETGDMWIGDVGQGEIEELTVLRPEQQRGANLGWSMYEGAQCYRQPCDPANKIMPQDAHTHDEGWTSIIGGQVYRGTCYPDLVGWHFYTDHAAGGLRRARLMSDGTLETVAIPGTFPGGAASLHADARGELFLTTTNGRIYHLQAGP
ncbi:MAG: sorbosone dehydrogenase family protein [Kofleriaceae bacterium]